MKKVTVKKVLDQRYEKSDSKYPVKLRVTYDRKQKYYATKYSMTEADWLKTTGKRPDTMKDILFELQDEEKKAIRIAEKINPFSWDLFEKKYLNIYDSLTLDGAFRSLIKSMAEDQPGTASVYESAITSLNKFKPNLNLIDVTEKLLEDYQKWMKDKSTTTISMYVRALRRVIRIAIKEGDFPAELYPFGEDKFSPPEARGNKRSLNIDVISKVYNYEGQYQKAKDFWFLSFFTNGMNMKDICRLKYPDIDTDQNIIFYKRSKTVRTKKVIEDIKIDYIDDLKLIVEKYGTGKEYVFPILYEGVTPKMERKLVQQFTHVVNNHLEKIAENLKIKPFTTYSARHSFAMVQRDAGLSVAVMSKMLGHSSTKVTDNYLGSLDVKTIRQVSKNLTAFKQDFAKVVNL